MGRDFESFSTERASSGGSNETCVSQLAVKMLASPSSTQDTAYRPYVNVRSTCFFVLGSIIFLHFLDFHHHYGSIYYTVKFDRATDAACPATVPTGIN